MNTRLQQIMQYKTGGRQTLFAELLGWTPQYLHKILKGKDFGLLPVLKVVETFPEIDARWFLTGDGDMLSENCRFGLRREAVEHAARIIEYERLVPVMDTEQLDRFAEVLAGRSEDVFSPETLSDLRVRADERMRELNSRIAGAAAKSDELCRQKTVRKW